MHQKSHAHPKDPGGEGSLGKGNGKAPAALCAAPGSRAGRPGKSLIFTWWKWFWRFQSFWEPLSSPTSTPTWPQATLEIKEQPPDPCQGNPKCSRASVRAENPKHGQKWTFCRTFSQVLAAWRCAAAALGCSQIRLLKLFPSPPLQLQWGSDRSCPSRVRCCPGRPEVVLAFPSQPSQPNPKF